MLKPSLEVHTTKYKYFVTCLNGVAMSIQFLVSRRYNLPVSMLAVNWLIDTCTAFSLLAFYRSIYLVRSI